LKVIAHCDGIACYTLLSIVDEIVASEEGPISDSFYFVDGKLVLHNKAYYRYDSSMSFVFPK